MIVHQASFLVYMQYFFTLSSESFFNFRIFRFNQAHEELAAASFKLPGVKCCETVSSHCECNDFLTAQSETITFSQ